MKIAFLSFYNGVVYRGVETYVYEISNRLVLKGHDVVVCQNGPSRKGERYKVISTNFKLKYFKNGFLALALNQMIDILRVGWFTYKVLQRIDTGTEIVVATGNRLQAVIGRVWTFFHKKLFVIPGQGGPGLDERLALWCFPDVFIPLSDYQLERSKKINPFVKIKKIPNGVDLTKFARNVEPFKFDLEKPIVLCAAAFWSVMKRQHLLIRAMSKIKQGSLLLVGEGEGKDELEKLGEKFLGKRFAIRSFPYDQMPSVYSACDLFSFPTSSWEAFGIVLVEAMASGLPVVANDDPIRREIVGDAGIFVDPTDIDAYAKALKDALSKNWGDKPRKQAEKFDWDKIALEYDKLFKELI